MAQETPIERVKKELAVALDGDEGIVAGECTHVAVLTDDLANLLALVDAARTVNDSAHSGSGSVSQREYNVLTAALTALDTPQA